MSQWLIVIYGDEAAQAAATEPEIGKVIEAYNAYTQSMKDAGVMLGANRLRPSSEAVRIRVRDKKRSIVDGPFTETKEVLGGYYLIECATREQAIEWAARCPGAEHAYVEVFPLWDM